MATLVHSYTKQRQTNFTWVYLEVKFCIVEMVSCKLSTSVSSPVPPFPRAILEAIHTEVVCLSHTKYRIPPWTWTGYLYLRVELDVEDEFQCTYSALVTDGHFITFCVIYYLHVDCSHMHHSEWNCSTISSGPPICWGWYKSCKLNYLYLFSVRSFLW